MGMGGGLRAGRRGWGLGGAGVAAGGLCRLAARALTETAGTSAGALRGAAEEEGGLPANCSRRRSTRLGGSRCESGASAGAADEEAPESAGCDGREPRGRVMEGRPVLRYPLSVQEMRM